jgi:triacylglycerol lipase
MARMSQLVYSDVTLTNGQMAVWGLDSRHLVVGTMRADVAWNDAVAIVPFRGTDPSQLADWIVNLKFVWVQLPQGKMHHGWYYALRTLEEAVVTALPEDGKKRRVWITGHSLGGALAVVCSYEFRRRNIDVEALVTFGQPMATDGPMAVYLDDQNLKHYLRFVNEDDIVTKIPPSVPHWRYTHFGKLAWFRDGGVEYGAAAAPPMLSAQEFPPGQRALTPMEFEQLKRSLSPRRHLVDEQYGVAASAQYGDVEGFIPMIQDHFMDGYVEKVRFEMLRSK